MSSWNIRATNTTLRKSSWGNTDKSIQEKFEEIANADGEVTKEAWVAKYGEGSAAEFDLVDVDHSGGVDASEFFASEVHIANCDNGCHGYWNKWYKETIPDTWDQTQIEILSGLTVAVAQIPEALAFAMLADIAPISGLYAVFILGLITAAFGGRPAMISGATGALAVVYPHLLDSHSVEYLYAALILMGAIEMIVAALGWPKYIAIIPEPVMIGFVNGLAIVIGMAQIGAFQYKPTGSTSKVWVSDSVLWYMLLEVVIAVFIIHFWPKVPKIGAIIPPPLIAIVLVTLLEHMCSLDTRTIEDVGDVSGSFPSFRVPDVDWDKGDVWGTIILQAIIFSCIGLTESLMTVQLLDKLTETKGNGVHEAMAQGVGNLLCGFFGGMGGCAMIGQSQINVKNGSRSRLSGIIAAVTVLIIVLAMYPLINLIPVAALVGVMVIVVVNTFDWNSFRYLRRLPGSEGFVIILVTAVTVYTGDLAIAVACGVTATCIAYCWNDGMETFKISSEVTEGPNGQKCKLYLPVGRLYFTSRKPFEDAVAGEMDPQNVTLSFKNCKWEDFTALCSLAELVQGYANKDKMLWLSDVDESSLLVMREAGTTSGLFKCGHVIPAGAEEQTFVKLHKTNTNKMVCARDGSAIEAGTLVVGLTSKMETGAYYTDWYTLSCPEAVEAVAKMDLSSKELFCADQAELTCTELMDLGMCINNDGFEDCRDFEASVNYGLADLSPEDKALLATPAEPMTTIQVEGTEMEEVPKTDAEARACRTGC